MSITATAQAGLAAAFQRFDQSAQRTARFGQDGQDGQDIDLASEAVEPIKDRAAVSANIAVLKASDEMIGRLLDLKA